MAETPPDSFTEQDRLARRVESLERRLAAPFREYRDENGTLRTRIGVQEDGRYGIRAWDAAGVLQIDQAI